MEHVMIAFFGWRVKCKKCRIYLTRFPVRHFLPLFSLQTSWGHVQLDNCNFEGAQLQVRGPGTCQARFCSFSHGGSANFLGVALSLLDSCDFSGSDAASVTVDGSPVSERNWACKHLAALARTLTSEGSPTNGVPPRGSWGTGNAEVGSTFSAEDWGKAAWQRSTGAPLLGQDTVIEDGWGEDRLCDGELKSHEQGNNQASWDYKLACDRHSLAPLLKPQPDGSLPPASSPDPHYVIPGLLSLSQELQRDPEAQLLATSIQGCFVRRCVLRDGKGGVHICNYGQARLEENVFRGLNYAVRCIQNSTVNMITSCFCCFYDVSLLCSVYKVLPEIDHRSLWMLDACLIN